MSDRVGQQLGNYQLIHLIGRGNFTDVYMGEHLHLNTQAAIKVLHARLTNEESEKLRMEARTMARLVHPHIIRVLEFGVEDNIPFLIMEYAPNGTLRQSHPKGTKVPLDVVVSYVKQVADALQYIHMQKLIHRDVKPESMLLGRNNEVLLAEFGIAIIAQSTRSQQTQQTQEAAGSVAYMAPEQLMGKPRPASDQYALAVVAYEWLSGDPPFTGSVQQIASQHLSAHPPSLRAKMPAISPAVEQVVMKALDRDPRQRFANVADFAMAMEEAFDAETTGRTLFIPASGRSAERGQSSSAPRILPTGTVTLLFTDIEESTHLLQQLGDRYGSLLAEYRHLLQASYQEWNGYEVDNRGDVISAAFARATDAVVAVVEVQRALAAHRWPEGVALRVRMGLHTGEPALTSEGYVGLDVHRAARIMSAANWGQVLLSQTTATLVEQDLPDDVNLRDLGEHRLKDLGRPKRLFQLDISGLPVDFPPLETLDSYPHNLPVQLTPFIGREQEVAAVSDLLRREDVRLLALTGPGGTGKTRLALQVAAELSDRFADGVFFVNLAPISDPALVLPTIAESLGIRERADQSLLERLKEHLRQKQILLLLDNFEQVVSAAAQVVDLLVACPLLKVMVTSREVPHVRARHEFTVPPLPLPDLKHLPDLAALSHFAAVALFISRAQAVKPDFQMTATNAHAIAEICARLDGLPLAIELAAARIKLLPPQALLARMGQRLDVLTSTSTDVPARQQTLLNTITWSYELLTAEEQRLFRRLSVFVGGCTLEAIEAVCYALDNNNGAVSVLDGVASLIDKSLLQQTGQEDEEPRLVMLETIREYGMECLAANGEGDVTLQAQARYYVALAEKAEPELAGPQQTGWLERLEAEYNNVRAVLRWLLEQGESNQSKREMALRLAGALRRFWEVRGHLSEGWNFLGRALAGSEGVEGPTQMKALKAAARLAYLWGDTDRAEGLCEEYLALCRGLGDTRGIAFSLRLLGLIAERRDHLPAARAHYEEAVVLFRQGDDKEGLAWSLFNVAYLLSLQGEYVRGSALLEEALTLFRELGSKQGIAWVLIRLADVFFMSQGSRRRVHALLEEGLTLSRELAYLEGIVQALGLLGQVTLMEGDAARASSLAQESLALSRELENEWYLADALLLGKVAAVQGDYPAARAWYEEGLTVCLKMGSRVPIANRLEGLAGVVAAHSAMGLSTTPFLPCLEGLAGVVAAQGQPTWAARLWGAAEALRENFGIPLAPVERADYERAVTAASIPLGEKSFTAAWAEGRTMPLKQVLTAQEPGELSSHVSAEPGKTPIVSLPQSPAGLTPREMDVLRLLAQGLTSAQIAERLVIGLVTVNSHVRSIYSKLDVTSRSAVTRYAIEHELL
jgi:predicted ATPase/serine/threonine protein kinase/DNA-binding CsgD family transcriptional regulator